MDQLTFEPFNDTTILAQRTRQIFSEDRQNILNTIEVFDMLGTQTFDQGTDPHHINNILGQLEGLVMQHLKHTKSQLLHTRCIEMITVKDGKQIFGNPA